MQLLDAAYRKVKSRRIEILSSNSGEYGEKTGHYIRPLQLYVTADVSTLYRELESLPGPNEKLDEFHTTSMVTSLHSSWLQILIYSYFRTRVLLSASEELTATPFSGTAPSVCSSMILISSCALSYTNDNSSELRYITSDPCRTERVCIYSNYLVADLP